ncbi:MAG: helix-turn-helix domain-containing protein [Winogradskyella sp.]|uniref:helix-turn-helix domain-containing protein n=1 Tax=Maribacter thermophilus TaxID=1197874 RepID=UPI00069A37F7|nr:helix-turn-helix transcriptional regulator [Maribacter thermophilus]
MLSELIKSYREKKGFLMKDLASLVGVDVATISRIENGERKPTKEQLINLIDALELDKEKVFTYWLSDKIIQEVEGEEFGIKAINLTKRRLKDKE